MKIFIISTIFLFILFGCRTNDEEKTDQKNDKNSITEKRKSIHQFDKANNTNSESDFEITIENISELTEKNIGNFTTPKFTHDGKNIIFSSHNFNQLWSYDLGNKILKKIIDLPGCGSHFLISLNNEVVFRNKALNGKRTSGIYSIMKYSLVDDNLAILYKSEKRINSLQIVNNHIAFLEDELPKRVDIKTGELINISVEPYYFVNNNLLIRQTEKLDTIHQINNKFKIINCSFSSDGEILFILTSSNGMVVLNKNAQPLNIFEDAVSICKLLNSNLLVYNYQKDDGHAITGSELGIGFINSTKKIIIPNNEKELRFNPNWSPVENKIIYNTNDGIIKIIDFNIEKKST